MLKKEAGGQHCAPSELGILQQLEEVVVMPNYHRLFPGGPRKFLNYFRGKDCDGAAKRLACWVSAATFMLSNKRMVLSFFKSYEFSYSPFHFPFGDMNYDRFRQSFNDFEHILCSVCGLLSSLN